MNELVCIKRDEPVTDSIQVAQAFKKKHKIVLRAIENKLANDSAQNRAQCFYKRSTKMRLENGTQST